MRDYYNPIKSFCLKWDLPPFWDSGITQANMIREIIKALNAMLLENKEIKEIVEDFILMFDGNLDQTVSNILNEWKNSGILEGIINETLFNQKLDKSVFEENKIVIDNKINLLKEINVNVKEYGAVGDGITDDTIAIQNCIDENANIIFPVGEYLITKPLIYTVFNQNITGSGSDNYGTVISKRYNETHSNVHDDVDGIDAVFITKDSIGDVKISNFKLKTHDSNSQLVKHGIYVNNGYRLDFENINIENFVEGISLQSAWGSLFKKIRIRSCENYGVRIEDTRNPSNQRLITSLVFDGLFVERTKFAVKCVNTVYSTFNGLSTDFITEVSLWCKHSTITVNGFGLEYSESQAIRCHMSEVSVSALFGLGFRKKNVKAIEAVSNAKFEVTSDNRYNTGLTITGAEIRSVDPEYSVGLSTFYHIDGGSYLNMVGCRFSVIHSWGTEVNNGNINKVFELYNSAFSINGKKVLTEA